MATSIALNSSVTLDESPGLQNSGTAVGSEDNNDNDISPADLQASFKLRLDALNLTTYVGAARSAADLITVSSDGTLNGLGFTTFSGTTSGVLPTYTAGALGTAGFASNLSAVDGGLIGLFSDAVLGNRMVLGVDVSGDIVFALFMEPNSALTSARVWMAQFEALINTDTGNPDDAMSLSGLGVGASGSLNFNFNALPSGQNLFGTVGNSSDGLVVIGKTPVANGTSYSNTSDTINTSQGGGPTTIGINNQMFDPGDGAYFTYVKNPTASFLAGAPNGLDQNEADNVANIQYTGGTTAVSTGFAIISQTQGNVAASMSIAAFDISGAPQGAAFITALGQGAVNITEVRVYNGTTLVDSDVFGPTGTAVATVEGLRAGYKVEWDTVVPHDQVLLSGVSGKFDIGGFGAFQDIATAVPLTNVRFEDDGPTLTASATNAPTLTVDESTLMSDASGEYAAQFTPVFGTDGPGAAPRSYALSTPGGDSGLVDTASNQSVVLSLVGSQVQGRTATSDALVFTVSVSATGAVTLDQLRAVKHADITATDESRTLTAANLVVLTGSAVDGDGDSVSAPLNIGQLLVFEDDAPTIGNISSSVVDFVKDASTGPITLNGAVGADTNTSPYTVSQFTQTITTNGVELKGVLSANSQEVIYWADTNSSSTFGDTGDTAYYQLTLGQAGAGNYTFTVLADPPPATSEFNFNSLPSGQNLFGMVGNPDDALVVFGKVSGNTINTSQGGGPTTIGINNQMFDANEGAYFTFVTNPDSRYLAGAPGGLDQNEADVAANIQYGDTLEVSTSFVLVSQTQGNVPGSMRITAFDIDGAPQGAGLIAQSGTGKVNITEVRVLNGESVVSGLASISGGVATVTGLQAGYKVEWTTDAVHDQVLIDATGGKFDIGGFGTTQSADTPDQLLAFQARVTDGDGDTALDDFTIGIDGTGIYDDGLVGVTMTV